MKWYAETIQRTPSGGCRRWRGIFYRRAEARAAAGAMADKLKKEHPLDPTEELVCLAADHPLGREMVGLAAA